MPSILDDPEFIPQSKSVLDDPEFLPSKPVEEAEPTERLRQIEDEVRFEQIYGKPKENTPKEIIGAIAHGIGDSTTLGAKNKLLGWIDKSLGDGQRDFELEERYYKDKYPVTNLISGLLGAFVTPGGKEVSSLIKGGKTAEQLTRNAKLIAKTAGIGTDAAMAAIYNFMRSGEGEGLGEAATGAGISTGLSLGLPLVGKGLAKTGSKVMDWVFGLPKEIQDKIKANPEILRNVKGPDELSSSLVNLVKKAEEEAFRRSETARSKLNPEDILTPERIGSAVENVQEGLGDVAGLPLEQNAFNRLEKIKKGFSDKLTTPDDLKTFLQKLRTEAYEKTTEGPTKEALEKTQFRLDQILKENDPYREAMKPVDQLTRVMNEVKKRFDLKREVSPESSIRELTPSDRTISKILNPDKLEKSDRYVNALSKIMGSDFGQELEKARLDRFLSQPRSNQQTGARLLFPLLGGATGLFAGGAEGLILGGGGSAALDKYGRRIGGELLGETAKAGKFLDENKLFKEMLSKNSNLNRKYAASHFIQSQVDPNYNKESSK